MTHGEIHRKFAAGEITSAEAADLTMEWYRRRVRIGHVVNSAGFLVSLAVGVWVALR